MNRKVEVAFFLAILSIGLVDAQENKTLEGIVISENLKKLPFVQIYSTDTTILGYSDDTGHFKIIIPVKTTELLVRGMYLGVEWTRIKIKDGCQRLEIIMMMEWLYDFISVKRINRKRYRRFKQLPRRHQEAYEQGIFQFKKSCVNYVFEVW